MNYSTGYNRWNFFKNKTLPSWGLPTDNNRKSLAIQRIAIIIPIIQTLFAFFCRKIRKDGEKLYIG